tara:strand:- start:947 stop:1192 length:246 start_codon:yes stop_codon:yes gene_type:complete
VPSDSVTPPQTTSTRRINEEIPGGSLAVVPVTAHWKKTLKLGRLTIELLGKGNTETSPLTMLLDFEDVVKRIVVVEKPARE